MTDAGAAPSDILTNARDPNPIIDPGCPRSAGGVLSASALCQALGIDMELKPLDCTPFYHGYGENCSDAHIVFAIWELPVSDLYGTELRIPFYVTHGDGVLLLGNNVMSKCDLLGSENILIIPPKLLSSSPKQIYLPVYTTSSLRSYLNVVPSRVQAVHSFFTSSSHVVSQFSPQKNRSRSLPNLSKSAVAKRFAARLHKFTHMTAKDMTTLCSRAGVLNPVLRQALKTAPEKCVSCNHTGRPLPSRKISFSRVLLSFNDNVQVDYFFIKEFSNVPILHIVDTATGLSSAEIVSSRDKKLAASSIERCWFNVHGPPLSLAADPEFDSIAFRDFLHRYSCKFEGRPARRHNKMGIVERRNATVRLFVERLLHDVSTALQAPALMPNAQDILARAVFLSNLMYGSKSASSFELARGYTPSIHGLPQPWIHCQTRTIPCIGITEQGWSRKRSQGCL